MRILFSKLIDRIFVFCFQERQLLILFLRVQQRRVSVVDILEHRRLILYFGQLINRPHLHHIFVKNLVHLLIIILPFQILQLQVLFFLLDIIIGLVLHIPTMVKKIIFFAFSILFSSSGHVLQNERFQWMAINV